MVICWLPWLHCVTNLLLSKCLYSSDSRCAIIISVVSHVHLYSLCALCFYLCLVSPYFLNAILTRSNIHGFSHGRWPCIQCHLQLQSVAETKKHFNVHSEIILTNSVWPRKNKYCSYRKTNAWLTRAQAEAWTQEVLIHIRFYIKVTRRMYSAFHTCVCVHVWM